MRRRRGNGKKRFFCGHVGKGNICHRCEKAKQLEEMAEAGKLLMTNKNKPKPKTWTKKEMLDEASRLKKVQV